MLGALYQAERYRDLAHERRTLTAFSVSSKLKPLFAHGRSIPHARPKAGARPTDAERLDAQTIT